MQIGQKGEDQVQMRVKENQKEMKGNQKQTKK